MDTKKDYQSYVRDWDEATAGCKPATLVVHPKSTGMYDPYNATGPPMYQVTHNASLRVRAVAMRGGISEPRCRAARRDLT